MICSSGCGTRSVPGDDQNVRSPNAHFPGRNPLDFRSLFAGSQFQAFFSEAREIENMMAASGASAEPVVTFLRTLDTGDDV